MQAENDVHDTRCSRQQSSVYFQRFLYAQESSAAQMHRELCLVCGHTVMSEGKDMGMSKNGAQIEEIVSIVDQTFVSWWKNNLGTKNTYRPAQRAKNLQWISVVRPLPTR